MKPCAKKAQNIMLMEYVSIQNGTQLNSNKKYSSISNRFTVHNRNFFFLQNVREKNEEYEEALSAPIFQLTQLDET